MKLRQSQTTKLSLSSTLRSWLPILQSDLESIEEIIEPFVKDNPFIEVKSGFERRANYENIQKIHTSDFIESLTFSQKSLYEVLQEQIVPPLFPTDISQKIAYAIIEEINEQGYFDGDLKKIAMDCLCDISQVEKIRKRFAYLDPVGIGAFDLKESFLFQLDSTELDDEIYKFTKKLIVDFENIQKYSNEKFFDKAIGVIKKFSNPPAISFMKESKKIIPDIFIYRGDNGIEISINSYYYPEIVLDIEGVDKKVEYVKQKIKAAKDLVDALEMRKATLYKIGLMILEYQYDFFNGGSIKPMKLKDLAGDLERNPSTISRAIANKYLSCERGVMPLKDFFSTAIDKDTSNSSIKEYISEIIKNEDRKKPISDNKILQLVEKKFGIKIVRRTITKYRKQLGIAGSSERKKLYLLQR